MRGIMEQIEIFQVLGIEPTKDERAIKNAYREKLAVTNPEDNPEGLRDCVPLLRRRVVLQNNRMRKQPLKSRTLHRQGFGWQK